MEIKSKFLERVSTMLDEKEWRPVDLINESEKYAYLYGTRLNKSDLSQYLSGKTHPGTRKLALIAKTLNVNDAWLVGFPNVNKEREVSEFQFITPKVANIIEDIAITTNTDAMFLREPEVVDYLETKNINPTVFLESLPTYNLEPNRKNSAQYFMLDVAIKLADPSASIPQELKKDAVIESMYYFKQREDAKKTMAHEKNGIYKPEFKKRIPILGRISAGEPILAVENIEEYRSVENESIDYGLIVKGKSMIGAGIQEGSTVYVDKDADIENGSVVVALINGEDATIKRFYKYGNKVVLRPENPEMKEREYEAEEVQILGKVIEAKIKVL